MNKSDNSNLGPNVAHKGLMASHPTVFFYILAFALTWIYWELIWAPLHLPDIYFALGSFGPVVAAFLMTAIVSGKPGIYRLLRSFIHWRVGVQWYLLTLLGVPALLFLSYLIIPGAFADFHIPDWSFLLFYIITFAGVLSLAGLAPICEEVGWRGFALPHLQQHLGPLGGTIIVGLLWGLWHLPFFFGPLSPKFVGPEADFASVSIAFVGFLIGITAFSVLMTWIFNNTGGSLLMAILLHNGFDSSGIAFSTLFPATATPYYLPISFQTLGIAVVNGIAALIVILATRGQLSYQRYQREMERQTSGTGR